jgi:hypothetical protein
MTTKYIVFANSYAVVFPDFMEHKRVADLIHRCFGDSPTSAGFVGGTDLSEPEPFFGFGESISMNLKANTETDSKLLNKLLT